MACLYLNAGRCIIPKNSRWCSAFSKEATMRVSQISIEGLFGIFNHIIPLNTDEHITIIHGPNGIGKTVLLSMLDGLFNSKYAIFGKIPFDVFRVDFDDGTNLRITKTIEQDTKEPCLRVYGPDPETSFFDPRRELGSAATRRLYNIIDELPGVIRVAARRWQDVSTDEMLSLGEVVAKYRDLLPDHIPTGIPTWLRELHKAFRVQFIQTNRLSVPSAEPARREYIRERTPAEEPAVIAYSRVLASTMQQTLAESAVVSTRLERSFPLRLISRISQGAQPDLTEDKLRQELSELEQKRSRLMSAGLLEQDAANVQIPDQEDIGDLLNIILSVYVTDSKDKLEVYEELLERIEVFKEVINKSKQFLYKTLTIDRDDGLVFRTLDKHTLRPDDLSSGEQHEIVLLYELLFKMQPNSLILIDEPELSLHVAWQQQFLQDLQRITDVVPFDVLIATHSPQIIHDRWDLTVSLKGPENK
jgi:predicted ATP-binding protein involved in virulence